MIFRGAATVRKIGLRSRAARIVCWMSLIRADFRSVFRFFLTALARPPAVRAPSRKSSGVSSSRIFLISAADRMSGMTTSMRDSFRRRYYPPPPRQRAILTGRAGRPQPFVDPFQATDIVRSVEQRRGHPLGLDPPPHISQPPPVLP